jgi:hypothetical protein
VQEGRRAEPARRDDVHELRVLSDVLATAYWARLDRIFYAASWTDYADLFDDSNIGDDMKRPYAKRKVQIAQMMRADAQKVWQEFRALPDRARY